MEREKTTVTSYSMSQTKKERSTNRRNHEYPQFHPQTQKRCKTSNRHGKDHGCKKVSILPTDVQLHGSTAHVPLP